MPVNERRILTRFILKYKEYRFLWNKKDRDYLNRAKREDAYLALLKIYKEFDEEANIHSVRKKIDSLRGNYSRELRKVKASILEEKNGGRPYEPHLWYFDLFNFLRRNMETGGTSDNQNEDVQILYEVPNHNDNTEDYEEMCKYEVIDSDSQEEITRVSPVQQPIQRKRKRTGSLPNHVDEVMLQEPTQESNLSLSELEILGKSIAIQLEGVSAEQLVIATKLISDIIFHARLGKLTVEASVVLRKPFQNRSLSECYNLYGSDAEQKGSLKNRNVKK